jgi:hypothetical protein
MFQVEGAHAKAGGSMSIFFRKNVIDITIDSSVSSTK